MLKLKLYSSSRLIRDFIEMLACLTEERTKNSSLTHSYI